MPPAWKEKLYSQAVSTANDLPEVAAFKKKLYTKLPDDPKW